MNITDKRIIASDGNVILRELTNADLVHMVKYANNTKVSDNLRDAFPKPYSMEHATNFLQMINNQNPKTFFAIEYNGEYVGNISLSVGTDVYRKSAEIGYFIGEPFWNKGITTKAVKLIVNFGFDNLNIVRIHTGIFEYNKSSQRVLEKCGFIQEAIFTKSIYKNDKLYNEVRFALIKY